MSLSWDPREAPLMLLQVCSGIAESNATRAKASVANFMIV